MSDKGLHVKIKVLSTARSIELCENDLTDAREHNLTDQISGYERSLEVLRTIPVGQIIRAHGCFGPSHQLLYVEFERDGANVVLYGPDIEVVNTL